MLAYQTCVDCADLLRVGPLRRLDKRLLPFSLHCSNVTKGPSEAVAELQAMLQESPSSEDAAAIQAELEQVGLHPTLMLHTLSSHASLLPAGWCAL